MNCEYLFSKLKINFDIFNGWPVSYPRTKNFVVVAQLIEWLLPTLQVRGLHPVSGKIYIEHCFLSTVLKRWKDKIIKEGFNLIYVKYFYRFLNGPTPASFCLFSFFSNKNFTEKNCRLQQDWNSECRNLRPARWPLDHHPGPSIFSV